MYKFNPPTPEDLGIFEESDIRFVLKQIESVIRNGRLWIYDPKYFRIQDVLSYVEKFGWTLTEQTQREMTGEVKIWRIERKNKLGK